MDALAVVHSSDAGIKLIADPQTMSRIPSIGNWHQCLPQSGKLALYLLFRDLQSRYDGTILVVGNRGGPTTLSGSEIELIQPNVDVGRARKKHVWR